MLALEGKTRKSNKAGCSESLCATPAPATVFPRNGTDSYGLQEPVADDADGYDGAEQDHHACPESQQRATVLIQ